DALDRHGDDVADGLRLDVGRRAHARPQADVLVVHADLHEEVRDFLLRAGIGRRGRAGDLAHGVADLAVGIRVDADACVVADLHVDDVVLVDVDLRFYHGEVGDVHHFRAGELAGADDALAEPAVQHGDGAVGG